MLNSLAEYFGDIYHKFDKDNINITFDKKGHKIDD